MAKEQRLIDANALWKTLDEAGLFESGNPRHIAQQKVEEQPIIDAVEVVRCKDCKHGRPPICTGYFGQYVACHLTDHKLLMKSNDFCSYGERREGE